MTHAPPQTARLRHVLLLDLAALESFDEDVVARVGDRIASVRDETVLIIVDGVPGVMDHLPEPDYIVSPDGAHIRRVLSGDELHEWPPEGVEPDLVGATEYLAEALLVPFSEIFVIAREGHTVVQVDEQNVLIVGGETDPVVGVWVPDGGELVVALDNLRMFGLNQMSLSEMTDEAFDAACRTIRLNMTDIGFTAASLADNPLAAHDANYAAVWARDGVITGLWTLSLDDDDVTDCFRRTLRLLAKHQSPSGQIPANVRIEAEQPDYSGIGGIASIDSVLWFVIGAVRFAFHTGDRAFAEEILPSVEKCMTWLAAHDANNDGLIEIPESSDWMDLFPRSYNVLYDEVLWYQACGDMASLQDGLGLDGTGWRDHAATIADRITDLFWTTGEQLMELAGSSGGRFSTGEGHYLLSQVTPFDYGWRCDVFANLLASMAGLLTEERNERLFRFLWGVGINEPFPVRSLYPPIVSGADDWKDYFLVNFLNLPDHYHNGGIWPLIGGLWVRYLSEIGRVELAHRELHALAESCRIGIYGEWEFNEWLHGQTGRPMGKAHQAWSAASYINAYQSLHKEEELPAFKTLDPTDLQGI